MSLLEHHQVTEPVSAHFERPLFDGDKPASVTPEEVERLRSRPYGYEGTRQLIDDLAEDSAERIYWRERHLLESSLGHEQANDENYHLPVDKPESGAQGDNNLERVLTMARAVGRYGVVAAERYDISRRRVERTSRLFTLALSDGVPSVTIDTGAFITTALSLKEMKETDRDRAERRAADEALALLYDVQLGNDHPLEADDTGPNTGELALAAIADHAPAHK